MNIIQLVLELTIGRLVLALPEKDQAKINYMLKKHFLERKEVE